MNTHQTTQLKEIKVSPETEFLAYVEATYRTPKTIKAIHQHLRVFSLWYEEAFGHGFNPQDLTNYDLHLYRKHSLDVIKVTAATWNARLWALSILVNWMERPHLLAGIEGKEGVASTKHRSLSENELHRFVHTLELNVERAVTVFDRVTAVRDWACASLALQAGLRVEEITRADVSDVTINERSGQIRVRNGKGSKERVVPLNNSARRALSAWNELRASTAAEALFAGANCERVSVRTVQRAIESLGAQIGVPDLTPHWLRYTFAKRMERKGVALETIRDLLGHRDIETTKRYLRASAEERQSAVEE